MTDSERKAISSLLEEAASDVSRVETIKDPIQGILNEVIGYAIRCSNEATTEGITRVVPAERMDTLAAWAQKKSAEVSEILLLKQGEVSAYKKALEVLSRPQGREDQPI